MQGLTVRGGLTAAAALSVLAVASAAAREVPAALKAHCEASSRAAEAAEKSLLGKSLDFLGGGFRGTASTVADHFSISGKDGPFACSPVVAQREAADRARRFEEASAKSVKGPAKSGGLNLAAQADVSGALRPTLFNMPATAGRLQVIVDDIARAWPYKGVPPVKVLVSANLGFNAEARADNTIVVWLGVLAGEKDGVSEDITDNDLYYLLGHEYAHLALDHMRSQEVGERQRRFLHSAAVIYQRGAMLESSILYAESSPRAQDKDLLESFRDAKESHQHLRFMMDHVLNPIWGRMQEDEADAAGIDVSFLAGVTPRYSYSVAKFEASEKTIESRIDSIQANMTQRAEKVMKDPRFKSAIDDGDMSTAFNVVFEALKKGLYEGVRKWIIDLVSRDHRSAKARKDGMGRYLQAAYIKRQFLPQDAELLTTKTDDLRSLPELRNGLIAARAVAAAEQALDRNPTDKAEASRQIAIALKGPFGGDAYVRFTAARVALANGKTSEAIAHLEAARKAVHPSPEAYRELARLYANTGKISQAKAIIGEGRKRIPDSDYFLPSDIRVQIRSRQFDAVSKSFEACRASDRDQIMLDCQTAALDPDYKSLTDKDREKLKDLAYWGEQPKAGGQKTTTFDPTAWLPWKKD